ncbi:hypothetical protein V1478_017262, partial [Vespula squamosa]
MVAPSVDLIVLCPSLDSALDSPFRFATCVTLQRSRNDVCQKAKSTEASVRSIFEAARSKRRYRYPPVNSPRWRFALRLILHGKRGLGAVSITTTIGYRFMEQHCRMLFGKQSCCRCKADTSTVANTVIVIGLINYAA